MTITQSQFNQATINDLELLKFCLDANGNVAVRRLQGISARGNPVETLADLPLTGAVDGEAVTVWNDPVVGSTIMIRNGSTWVQLGAFDYNKVGIDATDIPDYAGMKLLAGSGIAITQTEPIPGYKVMTWSLDASSIQSIIEGLTDLDLSGVEVTFGTIGGDIDFLADTTINRTNTTNSGTQNFDNNYIANYDESTINYENNTTINIDDSTRNSTNSEYNYDGDIINIINSTYNSTNNSYNYSGDTVNYDDTTNVNYEGDVYFGGNIITMNNEVHNGGTIAQSGPGVSYTDLNNVLLCDLAVATATPIDPALKDSIQLIVGGSPAGNDLGLGITSGNPAIYGGPSNLRGNVLTPAIINNANFGVAFKFGTSQTINVSNFGFAIPGTDTILGVKAEVIFTSTANSVSVDCVTLVVYHTDGTPITTGVQSVTGLDTDNTDPLNPVVQISVDGVTVTGSGTPADPLVATGSFTDIGNNYLILTGTMAGTPPDVDITDTRITDTTPYLVFYETQPVGNITRTLTNGNLNIASDDNADTLDVKVLFWNIGPARQYMKGNTTLTGAGPRTVTDPRITATTPAMIMPRTTPVGYVTATTGAGVMTISSTGTEVGVIVDYIITLDTTNYSDGMPYNATLDDDDMFFRKGNVSGDDEAVKASDIATYTESKLSNNGIGKDFLRIIPNYTTIIEGGIYIYGIMGSSIYKMDSNFNVLSTYTQANTCTGLAYQGGYVYTADMTANNLYEIDITTMTVSRTCPTTSDFRDVIAVGTGIYAQRADRTICKVNMTTFTESTLSAANYAISNPLATDGTYIYAELDSSQTIDKLETTSMTVVDTCVLGVNISHAIYAGGYLRARNTGTGVCLRVRVSDMVQTGNLPNFNQYMKTDGTYIYAIATYGGPKGAITKYNTDNVQVGIFYDAILTDNTTTTVIDVVLGKLVYNTLYLDDMTMVLNI